MADLVDLATPTGNASTEEITTLNGASSQPAQQVQRIMLATVSGVAATDISATNPFPIVETDAVATGSITAADAVVAAPGGAGVLVTGASTAGSIVSLLSPGGDSAWLVQLTGTFGSTTVYFEASADSTNGTDGNWINVNGRQTGIVNTVLAGSATVAGVYRGNVAGAKYFRVRAVGGAGITVAVVIRMGAGSGAVFLNASVPPGTNLIGKTDGMLAHDAVETGNPFAIGAYAVAMGSSPTAVAAADRVRWIANRHGIPYILDGHPNIVNFRLARFTAAQTDVVLGPTVSAGQRMVLWRLTITLDNASIVFPTILVGFGATNTPTTTALFDHPGLAGGANLGPGILGIGGDGEELRITTTGVATGAGVGVSGAYFLIEG
jgi:hypothetical protein